MYARHPTAGESMYNHRDVAMRKIKVGMVLFPRFQLLDIAGPADAFRRGEDTEPR